MVVKRGVNENDVVAMARRFCGPQYIMRFIEYMDVGNSNGWRMDDVVPASEIIERISAGMPVEPLPPNYPGETALRYRLPGGGEMGVIASVTRPFCRGCTRARLTADGRLFTCLFASQGCDLRGPLRAGAADSDLKAIIQRVWMDRDDRYSEIRSAATLAQPKPEMSMIGG
jgi:cyclic pyranopterin phosphate synthase